MQREDRYQVRTENKSFSSSLLDSIYRSIEESNGVNRDGELFFYRDKTIMRKKKQSSTSLKQEELNNSVGRRDLNCGYGEIKTFGNDPMLLNSSSTSSGSSCGGGFSSSESDSFYSAKSKSSPSLSHCHRQKPKPIRTSIFPAPKHEVLGRNVLGNVPTQKAPKHETDGFIRTKSKAMKIYSDLKKMKQPISPGGKLASFINSLFTSGSPKNTKKLTSEQPSSIRSSVFSFSKSCLSTTTKFPSKENVGTKIKRSVRFYPVSIIVDEDSKSYEKLKIRHENEIEYGHHIIEENRRVAEAARELLNNYRKHKNEEYDTNDIDDDDNDDAASYASSDLFELDNLSAIGNERYLEELPVYETTHFDTNRAIAKGLIM